MKRFGCSLVAAALLVIPTQSFAQVDTLAADNQAPTVITLEQALQIALSENVSVKIADKEIHRTEYAKRGTYAALYPQINASGSYQRTLKKQVMYMDFDASALTGGKTGTTTGGQDEDSGSSGDSSTGNQSSSSSQSTGSSADGGLEIGRWNSWSAGLNAQLPLVNAQLWKSLKLSGMDVELAVEKARSSRLDMVTEVKQAFFAVLLSKEAFNAYKEVYENAVANFELIEKKYNVQRASEMEYLRAKTNVTKAIPDVYNSESGIALALWQLKAVMGVELDMNLDVEGTLDDFSHQMFRDIHDNDDASLEANSTLRQLEIQAQELAETIKLQQYASIPTLSLGYNYSLNAMTNDFKFSNYNWTPYSFIGLSLSIPIFSGGKRYYDTRQAQNRYEQLKLQQEDTERKLRISVSNSLITMETNMKSYYAAVEAVSTAVKSYDIVRKSYEVGRATLTDINDAQLALTQSRLGKSQAIYSFVIAKAQLEQTLGADFIEE